MRNNDRNGIIEQVRAGKIKIAFGSRLKNLSNVITLGVRPNLEDYTPLEWTYIEAASTLYYVTPYLAQPLLAMGKRVFPSIAAYHYAGDKIRQTTLFKLLKVPHPRTRVFFSRHFADISNEFDFPMIAKIPRSSDSGRGVFLIRTHDELDEYLKLTRVAYIQEYLPSSENYRIVMIAHRIVLAYERRAMHGEFRSNVAQGAEIQFHQVPGSVKELALETARVCDFEDVGLDIISDGCNEYVLEANFRYGRKGFKAAGIDYKELLQTMLERGEI